jgi:hypothetical protein
MRTLRDIPALREALGEFRRRGQRIGLVPTMGNLHEGHLALVETAPSSCRRGGRHPLRQSAAVRRGRGPGRLSAHPGGGPGQAGSRRLRPAVRPRHRDALSSRTRPADPCLRAGCQRRAVRQRPPRPLRRRRHRGEPAVQPDAAGSGLLRREGLPAAGGDPQAGSGSALSRRDPRCAHRARRGRTGALLAQRLPRCRTARPGTDAVRDPVPGPALPWRPASRPPPCWTRLAHDWSRPASRPTTWNFAPPTWARSRRQPARPCCSSRHTWARPD